MDAFFLVSLAEESTKKVSLVHASVISCMQSGPQHHYEDRSGRGNHLSEEIGEAGRALQGGYGLSQ